ncbi:hypothetical protein GOP47_0002920 [Adiantum capillus-veneris]|uniref:Ion transport domain-containing protein n=1 Tax=Adiantum capillus-veneris TaxID=13818 RepID=A0A9D4VBI7_ADICA|nr:hypothetical protein GOP47_0002920 [Adiantum capillus-veneris]
MVLCKVSAGFAGRLKKFFVDALSWGLVNMPGVMNPHTKRVQQWNKFFLLSCLLAVFVDPLFFFILSVNRDFRCIYFNFAFAKAITVLRSATDLVYFCHMLLQCHLAYIEPSSVGSGVLNDKPKDIIKHYLTGWFILDFVVVLPLPQIMIWVIIPGVLGKETAANFTKNLLRVIVLLQYFPRMLRFFPLLAGNSPTGFIFETAWSNFFINLLLFLLVAHVVGSCWYLLGLQRVNQCLRDACTEATSAGCNFRFLDCGDGGDVNGTMTSINASTWKMWTSNSDAVGCVFANSSTFVYGIYNSAVNVTIEKSFVPKYIYSLFWGFQQVSTLAGNQMPSVFVGEVLFVLGIVILGLLLTVLLIGNMQNFLLSLSRRRVDMQLRRHDVESWMARRHLPLKFRRKVRQVERFKWAANKGVNEEELLKSLPEDIEKEIRKALCLELIKKVRLFTFMEDQVLDAICQRLRQSLYINGSVVLRKNYPIEKMHFFIKGNLQRRDENGTVRPLQNGFCGEELLTWCLESEAQNPGARRARHRPVMGPHATSNTTVTCLGTVEAFSLSAGDLREVTRLYSHFLRNSKVQGALRYESPYWRERATRRPCVKVIEHSGTKTQVCFMKIWNIDVFLQSIKALLQAELYKEVLHRELTQPCQLICFA